MCHYHQKYLPLTAAKPGCEAAKAGCGAAATANLGRSAAEREVWAFPNTLISEAVDEVPCVVVNTLCCGSVLSNDVRRERAIERGMKSRTVCV